MDCLQKYKGRLKCNGGSCKILICARWKEVQLIQDKDNHLLGFTVKQVREACTEVLSLGQAANIISSLVGKTKRVR